MSTKYQSAKRKALEIEEAINHAFLEILDPTQVYHLLEKRGYRWDVYQNDWTVDGKHKHDEYFY